VTGIAEEEDDVLDDTTMISFRLRERRSSLHAQSKLDETAGRRQAPTAATAQFEEQFTAAPWPQNFGSWWQLIFEPPAPVAAIRRDTGSAESPARISAATSINPAR
jgi:hypothetical protein